VRCDIAKDEEFLGLMSKAGCSVVCVGFESVNTKTLQAYEKKQTLDDIIHAIRSFHRKKIKIHGMFVIGSDDDNEHTIWDTLKFGLRHKIDTIQMSILTPFPGTKVHEDLSRESRIFSRDWSLYDGQHIVFNPKHLSAKQLQLSLVKAYDKFYSFSSFLILFLRFRFHNALFRFMGYKIVREWKERNRQMSWLQGLPLVSKISA
jgi:radical SAM superfamily enzyme YgiQ (UPF0313 family)